MTDLPKVIASSEIDLGGFIMHVHVLDNGKRVIEKEDFERFFSEDQKIDLTPEKAEELARVLKGVK